MFYTIGNVFATINNILVKRFVQYNPLDLPPNTIRVRTHDGNAPVKGSFTRYETATLVPGTTDVYDVYKSGSSLEQLLAGSTNVVEVLGANTKGISNMKSMLWQCPRLVSVALFDTSSVTDTSWMFEGCTSLTTVPLFDTSNVTNIAGMFRGCGSLTAVPLFDTTNVTDMSEMFRGCDSLTTVPLFNTSNVTSMYFMFEWCSSLTAVPLFDTTNVTDMTFMFYSCHDVQTGALALYQQASSQTNPPVNHEGAFCDCGIDTVTGAAELAQIPSDWK